jgi:hypothetical protein
VRTLLYEAANVMLTRYKGLLKLKDWALAIAQRSNYAQGTDRTRTTPDAARRHLVHRSVAERR